MQPIVRIIIIIIIISNDNFFKLVKVMIIIKKLTTIGTIVKLQATKYRVNRSV